MNSKYTPREPESDIHPMDVYTPEMHEVNLEFVHDFIAYWGKEKDNNQITPWIVTDHGLARVQSRGGESFKGNFVETREKGYYALAAHFVKHTVEIDLLGIDAKTKIYPTVHQSLSILLMNRPISSGMLLGYPVVRYNPRGASDTLTAHLHNPESQTEATPENLKGLYAERSIALRHWVGVKL